MMHCSVAELLGTPIPKNSRGGKGRILAKEIPEWIAYWELKNKEIEKASKKKRKG